MSFVKEINMMQSEISESMYEDIIEFYEFCQEQIENIEGGYQGFIKEINMSLEKYKLSANEGWKRMCEIDDDCTEILYLCIEKKKEIEKKCLQRLIGFQKKVSRINVRPSERSMITARIMGFTRTTAKTLTSFVVDIFERFQEVMFEMRDEIIKYVKNLIGTGEDLEKEEVVENPIEPVNKGNEKIFNYKEMIKFAEGNGYEYKWSNGSHNIFEHKNSQKIVVIPSHSLGLGLSKKIIKQIQANIA